MDADAGGDPTTDEAERDRRARLVELGGEAGAGQFAPGSFGCHELLDRTALAANAIEDWLLGHPACLSRPEWFRTARRAFDALNDLYRSVSEAHISEEPWDGRSPDAGGPVA